MSYSKRVQLAIDFAAEKHKGQKRIGGDDYISHPLAVFEQVKNQGYDEDYQITALFHDLLEDTDATEEEILYYGNKEVLTAVKLLTKQKNYDMKDYIDGIKGNSIAFVVKGADRLHNLQCAVVASEEFKKRYVLDTVKWYLDFSKEIKIAVKNLAERLDTQIDNLEI